jgi:hypothetical protein
VRIAVPMSRSIEQHDRNCSDRMATLWCRQERTISTNPGSPRTRVQTANHLSATAVALEQRLPISLNGSAKSLTGAVSNLTTLVRADGRSPSNA